MCGDVLTGNKIKPALVVLYTLALIYNAMYGVILHGGSKVHMTLKCALCWLVLRWFIVCHYIKMCPARQLHFIANILSLHYDCSMLYSITLLYVYTVFYVGLLDMSVSRYDEELVNIDFSNPEDIFDFSAKSSSEEENDCYITHYSAPLNYSKLPRKLIAEPCVKLSELQSMTNCSYNNHREVEYQQVKIHCAHCGSGFFYPNQQNAREQLYYCPNCQANFCRRTDCTPANHVPCHRTEKMHCCVCGQVYQDLARFIYHCQSHDESEYLKVCANKNPVTSQPRTAVGPPALVAIPANDSNTGENPAYGEANILIMNDPIYSTLPLVNHSTVSLLSLKQVVYYNQMYHNQMSLHQHYLNMWLHQSTNRTSN